MKKIKHILLVFLILILIPKVYAVDINDNVSKNSIGNVTTFTRDGTKNYGVNKKWKITDKNLSNVLRTPLVDSSKKIYDFTGALTENEEAELRALINQFTQKYKAELIIVTYNLPYFNDSENEDFAADFYDYNDFGLEYEKYDGILLFRNTYSDNPYYDMYTFGNSQLYFSHSQYDFILDSIYDDLHSGNYLTGFNNFISMVSNTYESGIPSDLKNYYVDDNGYLEKYYKPPYLIITLISSIITLCITLHYIKKNKMVKIAQNASIYVDHNSINYSVKEDKLINKHLSHYRISSSSSGGGGGYHSSGGSSGGGHSSGGGRHG